MQFPDQDIIADLQSNPASIITKDEAGQTPLHLAVINKRHKVIDFILDHTLIGQVINAQDVIGQTPLHEAVVADDVLAVTKILSKKPNIELKNNYCETAYDIAIHKNNTFIEQQISLYKSINPTPDHQEEIKPLKKHFFPPHIQEKIDEYIKKRVPPNPAMKAKNKISKKSKTKINKNISSNEQSSQEME